MAAKISLLAAAVLVVTPAAVTMALPARHAFSSVRSVEVDGPVMGFTQLDNRIQVQLRPATTDAERAGRQRVVIRSASGAEMTVPLKAGQVWASAQLTSDLSRADALKISIE